MKNRKKNKKINLKFNILVKVEVRKRNSLICTIHRNLLIEIVVRRNKEVYLLYILIVLSNFRITAVIIKECHLINLITIPLVINNSKLSRFQLLSWISRYKIRYIFYYTYIIYNSCVYKLFHYLYIIK